MHITFQEVADRLFPFTLRSIYGALNFVDDDIKKIHCRVIYKYTKSYKRCTGSLVYFLSINERSLSTVSKESSIACLYC